MERAANDRYRYKTQGINGDFGNPDKVFQGQSQGPENPQAGARKNTEEVWAQTGSQPFHVSLFYGEELRKLTDEHAEGETRRQRVVDGAADPSKRNDTLRSEADDQTAKAEENQGNTLSGSDTRRDAQTRERVQLSESLEGAENRSPPPQPGDRFLSPSRKFPTFAASGFPRPDDSASASATTSPLPSDASTFQSSEGHRSLRLSPSRASALDKPVVDRTDGGEEGTGKGSMPKPMHTKHDFKGRSFHGSAVTQVRYVLWGNSSQGSDETATPSSFEDEKSQPTSEEENKGEGKVRKNVESVCTVDGATLHHLSCEVIRLHACYTVIDPHLLATYLREAPCVESVGFDQQAAPCIVEEETKPLFVPSLRPLHDDSEPLTEFSFPAVFSASDDTAGFRELVSDTWVERRKELLGNKGEDGIKREEENQPEDPEDVEEEKHRWRGPRDSSYADAWTKVVRRFKGLPNDPLLLWLPQWELLNRVTGVDASLAWKRTKGGSGSIEEQPANTIALVDFGFQLSKDMYHEDLWHKWWRNAQVGAVTGTAEWPDNCADGIDNDENGYVDDCFGFSFADSGGSQRSLLGKHGTAVASHCCAGTNNALGVASVGWNLRPMALRVDGSYSQIAEAVNYAADKGVKVINLSLGGPASPILRRMVEQADKRNITLVVAAGNHRCDLGQIEERGCRSDDGSLKGYPAAYSDTFLNMISVGATDKEGRVASFTNFDSSPAHDRIQVMAPGRELPSCSDGKDANNGERNQLERRESTHTLEKPFTLSYLASPFAYKMRAVAASVYPSLFAPSASAAGGTLCAVAAQVNETRFLPERQVESTRLSSTWAPTTLPGPTFSFLSSRGPFSAFLVFPASCGLSRLSLFPFLSLTVSTEACSPGVELGCFTDRGLGSRTGETLPSRRHQGTSISPSCSPWTPRACLRFSQLHAPRLLAACEAWKRSSSPLCGSLSFFSLRQNLRL
uniref:subtilisin n=1 Tax=Toxoplasma gondii (strain ATCC 50861 / VEG) TaxID=432359 RepID=A0A0F7UT76_TOXGV|nr:TPA: subtilase family serine protease, putative [Toxoplasma gondii VEG]